MLEWATDDAAPTGAAITLAIRRAPTARQLKVLDFLREYTATHGYPPTLREIGAHMGIRSTNGVNDHLRALERKGLIRRSMMLSRSCVPVDVSPTGDSFAHAIEGWRTENAALVTLLKKVQAASTRLPKLTPEFVVLLGDIRDAVDTSKGADE